VKDPHLNTVLELLASEALNREGAHLITVDELRAAGALDVPTAWQKSLGEERDLFSDLMEEGQNNGKQEPEGGKSDSSDQLSGER
jgi:hypothetical protein